MDEFDQRLDELEPGHIESHVKLVLDLIAAGQLTDDLAHLLMRSAIVDDPDHSKLEAMVTALDTEIVP